ncbi:unnamed protein product [Lactuca virosa]|uniref:BZIP domain-containing protein n=1 Tax=Lactuca virosa TaxID=75947 RepID=A0AAU9PLT4_9ASTR|nr:unnamed protein product [Lactuca virosa]
MGSNGGTQKPVFDGLSRQGSLHNLTLDEVQQQLGDLGKPFSSMNLDEFLKNDLTKKTVDEVWQDIQQDQKKKKTNGSESNINNTSSCKRQATLGEMTLEDFLVKAGIVSESSSPGKKNHEQNLDPPEAQWMNYQIPQIPQQQMGSVSEFGRKRVTSGDVIEKTVERRKKRMIKNRESAARSRARKQTYTHELENKISRLEEENERLRRQKLMTSTTLSGTGIDQMVFGQANITRDNTKFVNGAIVGERNVFQGYSEENLDGGNKSSEYIHDIVIKHADRHNLLRPETIE